MSLFLPCLALPCLGLVLFGYPTNPHTLHTFRVYPERSVSGFGFLSPGAERNPGQSLLSDFGWVLSFLLLVLRLLGLGVTSG
jgi:hypothetical protein